MPADRFQKYLPRNQYQPVAVKIEPETGARYVRTQVGYYAIPPVDELIFTKTEFTPPATWGEFRATDVLYDKFFLEVFGPEYGDQAHTRSAALVPITAQMIMAKAICRKQRIGVVDKQAVLLWVNWTRIDPCWYLMGSRESHWLLSEDELGVKHG